MTALWRLTKRPARKVPCENLHLDTVRLIGLTKAYRVRGQSTGAVIRDAIAKITLGSANGNLSFTDDNDRFISRLCDGAQFHERFQHGYASVSCDANYAYVSSLGIANHTMMNGITATNLQVPTVQKFNGSPWLKIPSIQPSPQTRLLRLMDQLVSPSMAYLSLIHASKAVAKMAIPKYWRTRHLQRSRRTRADDYHYHALRTCVMAAKPSSYWDNHPVGWALDGFAIYGYNNADGKVAPRDSVCGGNTDAKSNGPAGYAYHVRTDVPSCFATLPRPC